MYAQVNFAKLFRIRVSEWLCRRSFSREDLTIAQKDVLLMYIYSHNALRARRFLAGEEEEHVTHGC